MRNKESLPPTNKTPEEIIISLAETIASLSENITLHQEEDLVDEETTAFIQDQIGTEGFQVISDNPEKSETQKYIQMICAVLNTPQIQKYLQETLRKEKELRTIVEEKSIARVKKAFETLIEIPESREVLDDSFSEDLFFKIMSFKPLKRETAPTIPEGLLRDISERVRNISQKK